MDPDPSINKQKSKKNLDFFNFEFCDFFFTLIYSIKTGLKCPLQKVKSKKLGKKLFFVGILSATGEKSRVRGSGSDPYQNVTDPQHRRWRSASGFFSVSDPVSVYLYTGTEPVPDSSPTHCFFQKISSF
jgi:hypothetical protein